MSNEESKNTSSYRIKIKGLKPSEECCKQINNYLKMNLIGIRAFEITGTGGLFIELDLYLTRDGNYHKVHFNQDNLDSVTVYGKKLMEANQKYCYFKDDDCGYYISITEHNAKDKEWWIY